MPVPGEYVADRTEGITRVEDLPKPQVVRRGRNYSRRPCPRCERSCYRKRTFRRTLHDLGDLVVERPRDLHLTYSQHYCCQCKRYFNVDMSDLAPAMGHYTHRVVALAVRLVVEDGLPYRAASWHLWRDHRVFVPYATIQNWVEAGGKKGRGARRRRVFQRRLADFSGYIAADELYDGPFCVLSIVDRRCRTATALDKLAKLRRRVRRFKKVGKTLQKLFSSNLEKALTFLDDKLLPSTSKAVERGYRRHRKMQKTVYRVRTRPNITARIALDMQREERTRQRGQTTKTLHTTRARKAA